MKTTKALFGILCLILMLFSCEKEETFATEENHEIVSDSAELQGTTLDENRAGKSCNYGAYGNSTAVFNSLGYGQCHRWNNTKRHLYLASHVYNTRCAQWIGWGNQLCRGGYGNYYVR